MPSLKPLLPFLLLLTLTPAQPHLLRRNGTNPSLSGPAVDLTSGKTGTYPRANFLTTGNILAAYAATVAPNKQLTLALSPDSGTTWSNIGTAATRPLNASDLDNPYPLQLPTGRVLLAYRNHDKDPATGNYTAFRIDVSYSDDDGASWSYLSTPAAMPAGVLGVWEPFLRNARDGSLQIYYSKEAAADDQNSMMRVSRNGGLEWGAEVQISGQGLTTRDGMVGVATTSGSNLIAVFETVPPGGTFSVHSITSPDDGVTWGDRQTVYTPTGTGNNAGAPQVVNVGGTMCVSFMTDEDTQEHDWPQGAAAKMLTAEVGNILWGSKTQVFAPQADWPGMLTLDGGSLLYMANEDAQKVVLS